MQYTTLSCVAAFTLLLGLPTVDAHTWVEDLHVVGSNGSLVGDAGYIRGIQARTAAGDFGASGHFMYLIGGGNPLTTNTPICGSSQASPNQIQGYPSLSASAGDFVSARYNENGHVTQPNQTSRGLGGGIVFVYGTSKPDSTTLFSDIHRVWNPAGTNGDGKLLATQFFDDGRCHQTITQKNLDDAYATPEDAGRAAAVANIGQAKNISDARFAAFPTASDLWCQTAFQLPADIDTSTYTVYWVWEWPTLNEQTGAIITNETYTSCMDINITKNTSGGVTASKSINYKVPEAYDLFANSAQIANPIYIPSPYPQIPTTTAGPLTGMAPQPSIAANASATPTTVSPKVTSASLPMTTAPKASASAGTSRVSGGAGLTVTITQTVTATAPIITTIVTVTGKAPVTSSPGSSILATSPSIIASVSPSPASAGAAAATGNTTPVGGAPTVVPFLPPAKLKMRRSAEQRAARMRRGAPLSRQARAERAAAM